MRIPKSDFLQASARASPAFITAVLEAAMDHGDAIEIDPERYKALARQFPKSQISNFKSEMPSKGLGDTVAKLTHAIGIDKALAALGLNCRCDQRQEALNRAVPYR